MDHALHRMHSFASIQYVLQFRLEGRVREVIDQEYATEQPLDLG